MLSRKARVRGPLVAQTSIRRLAQPWRSRLTGAQNYLQMEPFRGVHPQASWHLTRPVTPEVAGSSPVAPASKTSAKHCITLPGQARTAGLKMHRLLPGPASRTEGRPRTTCKWAVIAPHRSRPIESSGGEPVNQSSPRRLFYAWSISRSQVTPPRRRGLAGRSARGC
jgi:hypothetical protein